MPKTRSLLLRSYSEGEKSLHKSKEKKKMNIQLQPSTVLHSYSAEMILWLNLQALRGLFKWTRKPYEVSE